MFFLSHLLEKIIWPCPSSHYPTQLSLMIMDIAAYLLPSFNSSRTWAHGTSVALFSIAQVGCPERQPWCEKERPPHTPPLQHSFAGHFEFRITLLHWYCDLMIVQWKSVEAEECVRGLSSLFVVFSAQHLPRDVHIFLSWSIDNLGPSNYDAVCCPLHPGQGYYQFDSWHPPIYVSKSIYLSIYHLILSHPSPNPSLSLFLSICFNPPLFYTLSPHLSIHPSLYLSSQKEESKRKYNQMYNQNYSSCYLVGTLFSCTVPFS